MNTSRNEFFFLISSIVSGILVQLQVLNLTEPKVVSNRIVRAFNRPRATQVVTSKAFEKVLHTGLLHRFKSYVISSQVLAFSVIDGRDWSLIGNLRKNIPLMLVFLKVLYGDLPDDIIFNIAIYAGDTTLYSKRGEAFICGYK